MESTEVWIICGQVSESQEGDNIQSDELARVEGQVPFPSQTSKLAV